LKCFGLLVAKDLSVKSSAMIVGVVTLFVKKIYQNSLNPIGGVNLHLAGRYFFTTNFGGKVQFRILSHDWGHNAT
jgi:hypothetical protein